MAPPDRVWGPGGHHQSHPFPAAVPVPARWHWRRGQDGSSRTAHREGRCRCGAGYFGPREIGALGTTDRRAGRAGGVHRSSLEQRRFACGPPTSGRKCVRHRRAGLRLRQGRWVGLDARCGPSPVRGDPHRHRRVSLQQYHVADIACGRRFARSGPGTRGHLPRGVCQRSGRAGAIGGGGDKYPGG